MHPRPPRSFALFLLLLVLSLLGCSGGDPSSTTAEPSAHATTEAVSGPGVSTMYVQTGTLQMVSPRGRLSQDRQFTSPDLILITVLVGTCRSQYSFSTSEAILCVNSATFNAINADLAQWATQSKRTVFDLYYDGTGYVYSYDYYTRL